MVTYTKLKSHLKLKLPGYLVRVNNEAVLSQLVRSLRAGISQVRIIINCHRRLMVRRYTERRHSIIVIQGPVCHSAGATCDLELKDVNFGSGILCISKSLVVSSQSLSQFVSHNRNLGLLINVARTGDDRTIFISADNVNRRTIIQKFRHGPASNRR